MKGTNENLKNSKRIQLYKNKGDISNFNTTIRTNLNKFKIDLSKDLRYKFLNKYGAKDDFNFDIYIFPPPPGTIPSGYYQIPGDITKWRTAYQEKWVSSGGGPSDHGWYSSYWEGNWTSYNTLYYTANFMEYSPTTGKFSNIRSYSVPIRYGATEYHGGTSGSGAYTTHYSGRYSDIGNRGNDYWPSNFSCTFTPPEYIEGWTLYEHSGNIYKYKKTEYGAEIKTKETNTSGKKNGISRAPNIPDYVSKAASRDYKVRSKLGNSYRITYWAESRTKTITPQYNYRMSFDCTTGTFSNPVYDYIENVSYSSWSGSGIALLESSTNAISADFTWVRS